MHQFLWWWMKAYFCGNMFIINFTLLLQMKEKVINIYTSVFSSEIKEVRLQLANMFCCVSWVNTNTHLNNSLLHLILLCTYVRHQILLFSLRNKNVLAPCILNHTVFMLIYLQRWNQFIVLKVTIVFALKSTGKLEFWVLNKSLCALHQMSWHFNNRDSIHSSKCNFKFWMKLKVVASLCYFWPTRFEDWNLCFCWHGGQQKTAAVSLVMIP